MNDDFIQRLYSAESDFLTALGSGTQMLTSYSQTWSVLLDDLSTASLTGSICQETSSLVHSVASRIESLASCFLDIRRKEELLTTSLQKDCDAILHQMATLNLNANPKSFPADNKNDAHFSRSYTPASDAECSSPPSLAAAHQWLLDNLHNPYPSAEVKARIAATSSCQVSSINSWFINARRRIGWTTLCREHFSNCRADMIDAAYRALVEEDPQRGLSPELRHSFVVMRVVAENLYSSTLTKSAFAGDLDAIVKDMAKENVESAEIETRRQVKQANLTKAVQDSYPSPDSSVASPLVLTVSDSLTAENEEDEDAAPPVIAGSKRRRPSIEPVDQPSSTPSRPIKRLRAPVTSQTSLPSPPSSTDGIDESLHRNSPELPHAHSTLPETNKVLASLNGYLPDAGATEMQQHPHGSMVAPHLQTVSDPLSCSNMDNEYSIDDWFNANFDALFTIPPPVDATEPDFSARWEVELFKDYCIPGNSKYMKCPPTSTAAACIPPSDLSDLDSLLQSIDSDTIITSAENLPAITGTSYTSSLGSSICDVSQTSADWTSLLNSTEAYQSILYSTLPEYSISSQPLPEIDLSMLQLPQVMPAVSSQGDSASKQARLQQLHAMQEAVWRMEQELRSDGVVI